MDFFLSVTTFVEPGHAGRVCLYSKQGRGGQDRIVPQGANAHLLTAPQLTPQLTPQLSSKLPESVATVRVRCRQRVGFSLFSGLLHGMMVATARICSVCFVKPGRKRGQWRRMGLRPETCRAFAGGKSVGPPENNLRQPPPLHAHQFSVSFLARR